MGATSFEIRAALAAFVQIGCGTGTQPSPDGYFAAEEMKLTSAVISLGFSD